MGSGMRYIPLLYYYVLYSLKYSWKIPKVNYSVLLFCCNIYCVNESCVTCHVASSSITRMHLSPVATQASFNILIVYQHLI
jgi:hypothetical protein